MHVIMCLPTWGVANFNMAVYQFDAFLGPNEDPTGQFILLSDEESTDDFMTHYYIHKAVKGGHSACIVSLLHTFSHYSSICSKLGGNLSKALETGLIRFIDCLSTSLGDTPTTNHILQSPNNSDELRMAIINAIDDIHGNSKDQCRHICVIFDDLDVLLSLGWSPVGVVKLIHSLYHRLMKISNSTGYMVVVSHDLSEVEEVGGANSQLYLSLSHLSSLHLKMAGLSTGYSKEVHGEVTKYVRDPSGSFPLLYKTRSYSNQYRIMDRGIRLFAKGTSSAVL